MEVTQDHYVMRVAAGEPSESSTSGVSLRWSIGSTFGGGKLVTVARAASAVRMANDDDNRWIGEQRGG